MATILEDLRAKNPQYDDMTDEQLANAFHAKFYSDVPKEEFFTKIGLTPAQPQLSRMEQAKQNVELAGKNTAALAENVVSMATGGFGALAGGLAYLPAVAIAGDEQAQRLKSGIEEAMTYQPRTEMGQQYQQGMGEFLQENVAQPLEAWSERVGEKVYTDPANKDKIGREVAASIAYTVPQALIEAASYLSGGALAKVARGKARAAETRAGKMQQELDRPTETMMADAKYDEAVKTLQNAKPEEMAALIDADPAIVNAIDELGLDTPALASYYSRNPQYKSIEQGLASVDASALNLQQKAFAKDLAQKADNIIDEFGGNTDRDMLSTSVKNEMLDLSKQFYDVEDMLYKGMREKLPPSTRVNAQNTIGLLESMAQEMGGIDKLDASLQSLYRKLKTTQTTKKGAFDYGTGKREQIVTENMPTFAMIENQRKLIGRQIGKRGETEFKNAETGQLNRLYSALKQDQADIVKNAGDESLLNLQNIADRITIQRKALEENAVDLYGKELDKNMVNMVGASIKGLQKGEVDQFISTINKIPENRRSAAVLSAMNEAWKGTAASKAQLGEAQFARFWIGLNRNTRAKEELFKNLPPESRQAIENLGNVTKAVYEANQDKITTGRINQFFEDKGGTVNTLFERLVGTKLGQTAAAAGSLATKPVLGKDVKDFIMSSSDRAKAANQMLADERMIRLIKDAVDKGINEGKPLTPQQRRIEKEIMKSKRFDAWANTLEAADRNKLMTIGVVNYLISPRADVVTAQEQQ